MKFSVVFCVLNLIILLKTSSCQPLKQLVRNEFFLFEKVKNLVSLQIEALMDETAKLESSANIVTVEEKSVPQFSDPLFIGNFDQVPIPIADVDSRKIVDFKGVEFYGLGNATSVNYSIDNNNKKVTLSIPLSKAQVKGRYIASSIAGNFCITLLHNVTYNQTTQYTYKEGVDVMELQLDTSMGHLHFDNSYVEFENIDFDDNPHKRRIAVNLIIEENVFSKIFEEVNSKIAQRAEAVIQKWIGTKVKNLLDNGLHDIINRVHEAVLTDGPVKVDLPIKKQEFKYDSIKVKISSIKLSGVENVYLNESNVFHVGYYIGADLKFILPEPNISVIFTYQNGDDEKQVIAKYSIKHILVKLILGKEMDMYGVELQNCLFGVARIQPFHHQFPSHNHFEEGLIKHSSKLLYPYIAEAIEDFFANQVYNWVSRRTEEPKYFQRLRKSKTNFRGKAQDYYEIEILAMPVRRVQNGV